MKSVMMPRWVQLKIQSYSNVILLFLNWFRKKNLFNTSRKSQHEKKTAFWLSILSMHRCEIAVISGERIAQIKSWRAEISKELTNLEAEIIHSDHVP